MSGYEGPGPAPSKRQELCHLYLPFSNIKSSPSLWARFSKQSPEAVGLECFKQELLEALKDRRQLIVSRATCCLSAEMVNVEGAWHDLRLHRVLELEWRLGVSPEIATDMQWQQPMLDLAAAMVDRLSFDYQAATLVLGEQNPVTVKLFRSDDMVQTGYTTTADQPAWVTIKWKRRYDKDGKCKAA